jgi:hypothetical protein
MSVLELFNLSENLEVLLGIFKLLSLLSDDIIELALQRLLSSVDFLELLINFLLNAIPLVALILSLLVQLLLSSLDLHESAGVLIVVLLQLLQLAALLKQGLTGCTALILKDLLLFEVGPLGTLLELVTVVLVTHLQVVERVRECLDLFLALADLAIELISITLELFLLLGSLDHIVGLGVLTHGLYLS